MPPPPPPPTTKILAEDTKLGTAHVVELVYILEIKSPPPSKALSIDAKVMAPVFVVIDRSPPVKRSGPVMVKAALPVPVKLPPK